MTPVLVALTFFFPASGIAAEDEQWPIPDTPQLGHHSILIEESIDFFKKFSFVETNEPGTGRKIFCGSFDDPGCADAKSFHVNAGFAVCGSAQDADCIQELSFVSPSGERVRAEFVRYAYTDHPNMFVGDGKVLARKIGTPAIWRAADAPHEGGDLYLVISGVKGGVYQGASPSRNMEVYAHVFPVKVVKDSRFQVAPGDYPFELCHFELDEKGVKVFKGCSGSAADYGKARCVVFEQDGSCLLRQAHDLEQRIELSLRLLKPPSGWFHGRMVDPVIEVEKGAAVSTVTVSASPVRVPTFYRGALYVQMSASEKQYWDRCLPIGECSAGTRIAGSEPISQPDGNKRNVQAYESPVGERALNIIARFASTVGDTSIVAPTTWSFGTLSDSNDNFLDRCTTASDGLVAMVTTNATAYSEGPPSFNGAFLNYKVAGLHYAPDGKTPNLGTYDLVMRSDVARCLYGFSKAPVSATVAVVGENGEENIATTVVSEKYGWLKLAAYGFTFSEKEIQVQLRQSQIKTLTNFTSSSLSAKQKAEIRSVLAKSEGNTKFICTGIRYVSQPMSENIKVRARAKAACDYAKTINPDLSYWFQTKTTNARSYNGKVMVVSKG